MGFRLTIDVILFNPSDKEDQEVTIFTEEMNQDQITFMLSSINPRDALPINFPIPSFKKLVYFIAFVFAQYIYVRN